MEGLDVVKLSSVLLWAGIAGGALVAVALWRRRRGESVAESAGRAIGEGAVEAVAGAVEGIVDAAGGIGGALGEAAGGGDARIQPIAGRPLWSSDRNLRRLQGQFIYPTDGQAILSATRTVEFEAEIQNRSTVEQTFRLRLNVDELGLEPWSSDLGIFAVGPGSGAIVKTRRLLRSPLIAVGTSYTARLYADGFLIAGPINFRVLL